MTRVVVVGAGLAGLVAGVRLAQLGAEVSVVSKGSGGLRLSTGTVDVMGYAPDRVAVSRGMSAWFQRDPSSMYVQHAFGFGVLLEARLERLVAAGELDQAEAARFRQLIARQRSAVAP